LTLQVAKGLPIAEIMIKIDRLKVQKSINPYLALKNALGPLTVKRVRHRKASMFLSGVQS
jgi:hypothetical protein